MQARIIDEAGDMGRASKGKGQLKMSKTVAILAAIVLALAATDQPQQPAAKPPDAPEATLLANERALHAAVATADKAAFNSLVLPEGIWATNQGFIPFNLLVNGLEALHDMDSRWCILL